MIFLRPKQICPTCNKNFRKIEDLMQHQQLQHENRYYDCKECNISTTSMEEMRRHAQTRHSYKGRKRSN